MFPDEYLQQLPVDGPTSSAAIDLVFNRSTNTLRHPTSYPPSTRFTEAWRSLKEGFTFRSKRGHESDYKTPLGRMYGRLWGGGDRVLLAESIRVEMSKKERSWKIAKEIITVSSVLFFRSWPRTGARALS